MLVQLYESIFTINTWSKYLFGYKNSDLNAIINQI